MVPLLLAHAWKHHDGQALANALLLLLDPEEPHQLHTLTRPEICFTRAMSKASNAARSAARRRRRVAKDPLKRKFAARLRGAVRLSQLSWRALQALGCSSGFLSKHQSRISVARSRLQKRKLGILRCGSRINRHSMWILSLCSGLDMYSHTFVTTSIVDVISRASERRA